MLFDINGWEFVIILLVVALVVGPQRLPGYAEQLAGWVRRGRVWLRQARTRLDEEMGDAAGDVDWAALDPRKYDPRRIVRDALLEPDTKPVSAGALASVGAAGATGTAGTAGTAAAADAGAAHVPAGPGRPTSGPAPYDDEAT